MGNVCQRRKSQTIAAHPSDLIRNRIKLTDQERHIIKTNWMDFISRGKVNGGIYYFVDLLRAHPDTGIYFGLPLLLKNQDCTYQAIKHNPRMRLHVGKMFKKIGEVVDNIDHLECLNSSLASVGKMHVLYGVNVDLIRDGWPHLRHALNMHLNLCLTPKAERTWSNFYELMMDYYVGNMPRVNKKYKGDWNDCKSVDNDKRESII